MDQKDYPYKERGPRRTDRNELRAFSRASMRVGGRDDVPDDARAFQERSAAAIQPYPVASERPKWVLALIERRADVDEFAQVVHDRLVRAPTEANQRLALFLANEIARKPGGPEAVRRHLTPELLERIGGTERSS